MDKMDCWEALVDQWCSETWEASHNNAKERRGKMVGVPHHQGSVNLIQFGENWVCGLLHASCNSFLMLS